MRCELASKRGDSGLRRDTLRFDPREVRLCLRELGYAWVSRHGRAGAFQPGSSSGAFTRRQRATRCQRGGPPKTGEAKRS